MVQFEGPEKKFEVVVSPKAGDLRSFGDSYWKGIVNLASADILSKISNSHCDAYLLSESSLFVFSDRAIMLTCGQTTLVRSLIELISKVKSENLESLIFERKNEHFPNLQLTSFDEDILLLKEHVKGTTYSFGEMDGHYLSMFHLDQTYSPSTDDRTLEILMYGIDCETQAKFSTHNPGQPETMAPDSTARHFIDGFQIDDHIFMPSGYSLNAIHDRYYYTIHVTPETNCSFVSFETNYVFESESEVESCIHKVLREFRPERFDLIYFSKDSNLNYQNRQYGLQNSEYRRMACGYGVQFSHYLNTRNQSSLQPSQQSNQHSKQMPNQNNQATSIEAASSTEEKWTAEIINLRKTR